MQDFGKVCIPVVYKPIYLKLRSLLAILRREVITLSETGVGRLKGGFSPSFPATREGVWGSPPRVSGPDRAAAKRTLLQPKEPNVPTSFARTDSVRSHPKGKVLANLTLSVTLRQELQRAKTQEGERYPLPFRSMSLMARGLSQSERVYRGYSLSRCPA